MSLRSMMRLALSLGRGLSQGLTEATAGRDPIELFEEWFGAAREAGMLLPESMTLATCSADGAPSARMVLLKGVDEHGFVFYTNLRSRKSEEMTANPRAALCFHWAVLQQQVRIEGTVARLSPETVAAYFQTRPRGSRIAAWASRQSETLGDRSELERRYRELEQKFEGRDVPLPEFWGGFRLAPVLIEFWQGRPDRMHDRLLFKRDSGVWIAERLYP